MHAVGAFKVCRCIGAPENCAKNSPYHFSYQNGQIIVYDINPKGTIDNGARVPMFLGTIGVVMAAGNGSDVDTQHEI